MRSFIVVSVVIVMDLFFFRAPVVTAVSVLACSFIALALLLRKKWRAALRGLVALLVMPALVFFLGDVMDSQVRAKSNKIAEEMRESCLSSCPDSPEVYLYFGYPIRYFPSLGGRDPYITYERFGHKTTIVDIVTGKVTGSRSD